MPENSKIIRALEEGLKNLSITIAAPPEKWTKAVKTELCRIGRDSFGCKVYAAGVPRNKRDGGEWLYDVTWLEYEEGGDGELTDLHLAAECEWGEDQDIEDDFEKLLLARAGVRVMIIDGGVKPDSQKIADWLAGKVRKFNGSRADDAWLLAVVEQSDDGWSFRCFHGYSLQELKP